MTDRRSLAFVALTLGLVALSYAPSFSGPFVWDDHPLIEGRFDGRGAGPSLTDAFWHDPLAPEKHGFFRPLTTASYGLDHWLCGGRPDGFHLTNMVAHLAVCALVYALSRRLGAGTAAACAACGLFGVFPRLTESVSWISGRTDVLAVLCALGTLLLHSSEPKAHLRRAIAAAALFAGLLFKEVAAAGYAALLAWELRETRRLRGLVPATVAVVVYAVLRPAAGGTVDLFGFSWTERGVLALQTLGRYALMIANPWQPALHIGELGVVSPVEVGLGVAGVLGLAALAWRARRWPAGALALAVFSVTSLALVLHVIPLPIDVVAADRFLYAPLAGMAPVLAWGAGRGPVGFIRGERWKYALGAAVLGLFATFAWRTRVRARAWTDELGLWQSAARDEGPSHPLVFAGLGDALLDRDRPCEAAAHYQQALSGESPVRALAARELVEGSLALALEGCGHWDEAQALLAPLSARHPDHVRYAYNLALLKLRRLDFDGAETLLNAMPASTEHAAVGRALRELVGKARGDWRTLSRDDRPESWMARARFFEELGNRWDAVRAWSEVLARAPASLDAVRPAAGYLALRGEREAAQRALAQLSADGAAPAELSALRAVLAERWPDAR